MHAFCLMPNHFHLLVETPESNISAGMHYLNGRYAKRHNDRHGLSGHVIQGRYHSVLIERDAQLVEVARYIALNPVRAQLVQAAGEWRWSSHRYLCGAVPAPTWLHMDWILSHFGEANNLNRQHAYAAFVAAGVGGANPLDVANSANGTTQPLLTTLIGSDQSQPNKLDAMAAAYATGMYTREHLASHFGVSVKTVSRAIAQSRR